MHAKFDYFTFSRSWGVMLFNAINARKPHQRSMHSRGSGLTRIRFWSWFCSCNLSLGLGLVVLVCFTVLYTCSWWSTRLSLLLILRRRNDGVSTLYPRMQSEALTTLSGAATRSRSLCLNGPLRFEVQLRLCRSQLSLPSFKEDWLAGQDLWVSESNVHRHP